MTYYKWLLIVTQDKITLEIVLTEINNIRYAALSFGSFSGYSLCVRILWWELAPGSRRIPKKISNSSYTSPFDFCGYPPTVSGKRAWKSSQRTMWFQHDGCPVHFVLVVRNWLNQQYPERWIGRGSEVLAWPARSPDLTPLDFFLWGTLKDKVYSTPVNSREELLLRIRMGSEEIKKTFVHYWIMKFV